jgi:hypothetical protein
MNKPLVTAAPTSDLALTRIAAANRAARDADRRYAALLAGRAATAIRSMFPEAAHAFFSTVFEGSSLVADLLYITNPRDEVLWHSPHLDEHPLIPARLSPYARDIDDASIGLLNEIIGDVQTADDYLTEVDLVWPSVIPGKPDTTHDEPVVMLDVDQALDNADAATEPTQIDLDTLTELLAPYGKVVDLTYLRSRILAVAHP